MHWTILRDGTFLLVTLWGWRSQESQRFVEELARDLDDPALEGVIVNVPETVPAAERSFLWALGDSILRRGLSYGAPGH